MLQAGSQREHVLLAVLIAVTVGFFWLDVHRQGVRAELVSESMKDLNTLRRILELNQRLLRNCQSTVFHLKQERAQMDRVVARLAAAREEACSPRAADRVVSAAGDAASWVAGAAAFGFALAWSAVAAYWTLAFGVVGVVCMSYVLWRLLCLVYRWVRERIWNWRAPMVVEEQPLDGPTLGCATLQWPGVEIQPERYQAGSDPHPVSLKDLPPFQVAVYTKGAGKTETYFQGYALNIEGYLVMPLHVKEPEGVPHDHLVLQRYVGDELRQTTLGETITWMELAQDAVAADMSTMKFDKGNLESYLGLAKAKVADVTEMTHCSIVGGFRPVARTMGAVRLLSEFFGQVQYTGTTFPGYSGAAYYVNKTVYGMHTSAWHSMNVGYSAAYLASILRKRRGQKESSEDFLFQRMTKQKKILYRTSPGDPEEVIMKVEGRFYTFARDEIPRSVWDRMVSADDVQGSGESYNDEGCFLGRRPAQSQSLGQMGQLKRMPDNRSPGVSVSQHGQQTTPNVAAGPSGQTPERTSGSSSAKSAEGKPENMVSQERIVVQSPPPSSGTSSITEQSATGSKSRRNKSSKKP